MGVSRTGGVDPAEEHERDEIEEEEVAGGHAQRDRRARHDVLLDHQAEDKVHPGVEGGADHEEAQARRHRGHETSPVVDGHASPLPPDGRGSPEPRDHPEGEEEHAHLERPDGPLAEETRPRRERVKMGGGAREKTQRGQPHGDHGSARTTAHSWQPGELVINGGTPGLRDGRAVLEVRARAGFCRPVRVSDRPAASIPVTLDFTPLSVEVVSATRYWAKGGGGLVVVRSRGASRVAVGVGPLSFRAYPAGPPDSNLHVAIVALPWNYEVGTPIAAIAQDEAGNTTTPNDA